MFSKKSSLSISGYPVSRHLIISKFLIQNNQTNSFGTCLTESTSTTAQVRTVLKSSTFHQKIFVSIFEPCQKGRGRKWGASLTDGIHSVVSTEASRVGWRKRRPKPRKCHNCSQGGLKHLLAQAAVPALVYGRDLHVTMNVTMKAALKAALKAAKAKLPCFPSSSIYREFLLQAIDNKHQTIYNIGVF